MNQDNTRLQESLKRWSSGLIARKEQRFKILLVRSILTVSKSIDSLSSWAMVGVGGAVVAAISGLDDLKELIGSENLKISLLVMAESILFGLAQKVAHSEVDMGVEMGKEGEKAAHEVLVTHEEEQREIEDMSEEFSIPVKTDIDLGKVIEQYLALYPLSARWLVRSNIRKGFTDPNYFHRRIIRAFVRQVVYIIPQIVCVLGSLVFLSYCL